MDSATATSFATVIPASPITVTYSPITNKITFTTAGAPFSIIFNTIDNPPTFISTQHGYRELGFEQNVTYGPATTITSPNVVNFSGPNFAYLRSPMASIFNGRDMFFSNSTVTVTGGNILAKIPITENRNSVVNFIDESDQFLQWQNVGNKRLELYFTLGRRTDQVDFNGESFQVTIHGYSQDENSPYSYN